MADKLQYILPRWRGFNLLGLFTDHSEGNFSELAQDGVGVHCGEGGAFCYTPHETFLDWFRDVLQILTSQTIG